MRWDGKNRSGEQIVKDSDIDFWNMTIEDGTVYYITHEEKPRKMIWCPASNLEGHLRRLKALTA